MSKSLTSKRKLFKQFCLQNYGITKVEDNVFNGFRFNTISITKATNLTKISANAFNGTSDHIIQIDIKGKNQLEKVVK